MQPAPFHHIPADIRSYWENLNRSGMTETFGRKTTQRGKDYAQQGRVKKLWMSNDSTHLLAAVQGSEKYYTHIELKKEKTDSFSLVSECTCPVGDGCKHAAAACWLLRLSSTDWKANSPLRYAGR